MKNEEDEAFDELAKRQGAWGGGFQAKRQMAMDKINSEFHEEYIKYRTAFPKEYTAPQPAQEPVREALKLALITLEGWDNHDKWVWPETALEQVKRNTKEAITAIKEASAQPVQEPVACARCKDLEEQAYDLLGQLKAANLKWSVAHPWVGLAAEDFSAIKFPAEMRFPAEFRAGARWADVKLKEKNT